MEKTKKHCKHKPKCTPTEIALEYCGYVSGWECFECKKKFVYKKLQTKHQLKHYEKI